MNSKRPKMLGLGMMSALVALASLGGDTTSIFGKPAREGHCKKAACKTLEKCLCDCYSCKEEKEAENV